MLRRFLHWVGGFLPLRVIYAEGEIDREAMLPLFERYHLLTVPRWLGGWTVYLHHYLRSDPDRGLHDHPWPWAISVPLCGGYLEERFAGFYARGMRLRYIRRRPFLPYFLTGNDFHRVIADRGTSWSLFIHGPNGKGWGFLRQQVDYVAAAAGRCEPAEASIRFYTFPRASETKWWRTAPKGREQVRAAP